MQVIKDVALEYPEVGSKLQNLELEKKAGRPNIRSKTEKLHETILSIFEPYSFADERRKSEVYNSVRLTHFSPVSHFYPP